YSGFKSNSLVILGKTSNLVSPVIFTGGDVFNNSEIDIVVHTAKFHRYTTGSDGGRDVVFRYATPIKIKGIFSPTNSSQLFNNKENDLTVVDTIGDNEHSDRIPIAALESQDYSFEVKHE